MKTALFIILSISVWLASCRKDSFTTSADASVNITADTLKYDTVFTNTGSVTRSFKIINENNNKLKVTSVRLMGGTASPFNMNVDGVSATAASDIDIAANDSIYVFVQVRVNPDAANLPFIIRDSILISYNGKDRYVQLEAWGQNAHFIRNGEINGVRTWMNDLPYVILGYLRVNSSATLNIQPGCRLFFHADAPLVVNGTLNVNGTKEPEGHVYFQGDRLDEPYRNYPASWPGIYLSETSTSNSFTYAEIKNSYQALTILGQQGAGTKLTFNESIIDNAFDAGIVAVNTSISARNALISNCGKNIVITKGGNYNFVHSTIAAYSNKYIGHQDPVLQISNADGSGTAPLTALFTNCIFWGEGGIVENEVVTAKSGSGTYNVSFDHVLWKQATSPDFSTVTGNILTESPKFLNTDPATAPFNFRLTEESPAINKGKVTPVVTDLAGRARAGLPDLGCYEKD